MPPPNTCVFWRERFRLLAGGYILGAREASALGKEIVLQAGQGGGNQIIDALPGAARESLLGAGRLVHLSVSDTIFGQSRPLTSVYFPLDTVLALVTLLRDGSTIQLTSIGREGMSGFPLLLGTGSMLNAACICQVPGQAIAVPSPAFQQALNCSPELQAVGLRYVALLLTQIGQGVACSRLHHTVSRCARWLLATHDRVGTDSIRVTHEYLAFMLGTRRASVTEAIGALARTNLIRSRHGSIMILDRPGLEAVACECYSVIRAARREMLPPAGSTYRYIAE